MQVLRSFLVLGVVLFTGGCFAPGDVQENVVSELSIAEKSNVKIYIDPETGRPVSPTPERLGKVPGTTGESSRPVTVYNETILSDGSAILEPTFAPVNYLKIYKDCSGDFKVSHHNNVAKECSNER